MGYPLSTFQQLARFCREERFDSAFDRYKIVAIPFIGPADRAVSNTLKHNFERLHVSTGKYFAFFSFMTPPLRWQQEHPYWMDVRSELSEGLSTDEGRIIAALRERFNLPTSPTLLLTDNLRSDQYVVLPVNEHDLVAKMEGIGQFAEQYPERFPMNDPAFEAFLSRYDSVFVEQTENGESIARNVTDILAVDSLLYNTGEYQQAWDYVREDARKWVRHALSDLSYRAYSAPADQFETKLKRYTDYLALTLETAEPLTETKHNRYGLNTESYVTPHNMSVLEEPSWTPPSERFTIPEGFSRYLTPESQKNRAYYNSLVPFLMQHFYGENKRFPGFIPEAEEDFSPLGLYMGLIMEEELNASIVQLARRNVGIQMPRYYRLWDRTHSKLPVVENENGTIFLNCKKQQLPDGQYSVNTLTIGQTVRAIRQIRKDYPNASFGSFGNEPFLSRIGSFAPYRNLAVHTGRGYRYEDFELAHRAFCTILEKDMPHMASLKKKLMF